jgi:hypothetical protein
MSSQGLGNVYDVSIGLAPVDMSLGANTGKRVSMAEVESVTVLLVKAAGTAAQDPVLTLKQHTAATGGVTTDLPVIDRYWVKSETALAGVEKWTEVTQAAAASITDPGGAGTSAERQQLVAINVRAAQLTPGNTHVSVDIADVGLNAQIGAVIYILDHTDHGAPAGLDAPLR